MVKKVQKIWEKNEKKVKLFWCKYVEENKDLYSSLSHENKKNNRENTSKAITWFGNYIAET